MADIPPSDPLTKHETTNLPTEAETERVSPHPADPPQLTTFALVLICFVCPPLAIYLVDKRVSQMVVACFCFWLCFGAPGFLFSLWYVFCKGDNDEVEIPWPTPRRYRLLRWALRHR